MDNINDLIIDEESLYDSDYDYLTEWAVDPKKKKQVVENALKELQHGLSSNKLIASRIKIFTFAQLTQNYKNIFNKKKKYHETKRRSMNIGYYNFTKTDDKSLYSSLQEIINNVNSKLDNVEFTLKVKSAQEWVGYDAYGAAEAALLNLIKGAINKKKAGFIHLQIKSKDSIMKEFCDESLEFTDNIMNDLFE